MMKAMNSANNTGKQHCDELADAIAVQDLLERVNGTQDFIMPPGTPVADIVQAINLEFPGRDAEVVAQAAVLLHKKGTPPRSYAEVEHRFWNQVKAMGNPPRDSESMGRPVLPESSHAPSEPTAPSHSAPSTSDTADPTSAAKKSLDALPSEEALALQRAMAEALEGRAGAKVRAKDAPSIFGRGPETAHEQRDREVIPGMFQRPNGQYYYISPRTGKAVMLTSGDTRDRITKYKAEQNRLSLPEVPTGKSTKPAWRKLATWHLRKPQPQDSLGIVLSNDGPRAHHPQDSGVHGLRLHKLPSDSESRRDLTRNAILALLEEGASYASIIEQLQLSGRQELAQRVKGILTQNRFSLDAKKIRDLVCKENIEHTDGRKIHCWLAENIAALNAGQVFKAGTRKEVRAVILQRLQHMEYGLAA